MYLLTIGSGDLGVLWWFLLIYCWLLVWFGCVACLEFDVGDCGCCWFVLGLVCMIDVVLCLGYCGCSVSDCG